MRGRPAKTFVAPSRKIWADADDCPRAALDILFRTAQARRTILTLVGTRAQQLPASAYIRGLVVSPGFDSVPDKIAGMVAQGDLVVTADERLSAAASRKATVLHPAGIVFAPEAAAGWSAQKSRTRDHEALAEQIERLLAPPAGPAPTAPATAAVTAAKTAPGPLEFF